MMEEENSNRIISRVVYPIVNLGMSGELIGQILNPINGTVEEEIVSPEDGLLFTLREYPVVMPGSLIARVLGGEIEG